ncbi:MAG: hypothetical protein H6647_07400 [Anaerolineales bacterium]|nr:hypothetical protein [Anaerolineales bacterium]
MNDGFGTRRKDVMYNDFVVVSLPADPAGISGMTSSERRLHPDRSRCSPFISRGDDSGTTRS